MSTAEIYIENFSAEVEDTVLRLAYQVVSNSDLELGLLDRIPVEEDVTCAPNYRTSNAYLGVEGSTLVVRKAILPVPPGLAVSEQIVPGISRLQHRATLETHFILSLPVQAFNPYREAQLQLRRSDIIDIAPSLPRCVTHVRIILGYFEIGDARLIPIAQGSQDVFFAQPSFAPLSRYREVEAAVVASEAFEVMDYEEDLVSGASGEGQGEA